MSFRDYDLPKVRDDFQLTLVGDETLFASIGPVPLSPGLAGFWSAVMRLGLGQITEKARSELLTAPLLSEVWLRSGHQIALLSGMEWNVDEAAGLNGVADFLLCRSSVLSFINAPVLVAVEAKRDSIPDGLGQCAAEMVAAQRFNRNAGTPIDPIYGCVTTGANWKFLRLRDRRLNIDLDEYGITKPDAILGVLLHCCGVSVA